ncbi:MAG: hypothetical protein R3Y38_04125 [Rikenellaceae bacterium]
MRHFLLLIAIFLGLNFTSSAQTLQLGAKAPDIKIKEWINGKPNLKKAHLVEFFHTASKPTKTHIQTLNNIAKKHKDHLSVIFLTKEDKQKLIDVLGENSDFYLAVDAAGKTFQNYDIQFVPFCVLIDQRGKMLWFGNPNSLTDKLISQYL